MTTIAIIDDYLQLAPSSADWNNLPGGPEVRFYHDGGVSREELQRRFADVDILCTMHERTAMDRSLIASLSKLKLILGTGQPAIDMAAATDLGIIMAGARGSGRGGDPTAEITIGLMIAAMRHIPAEDSALRKGIWQSRVGESLGGRTLGVLGLGRIGGRVAAVARIFEMEVIAWGPTLTPERAQQHGAEMVSKEELFRRSDVITVHWKLTDATRGLVGADDLALMKPTAYLINTARGPLVQQEPLLDVLSKGKIAGAALDVYDDEPLPAGSPFLALTNTVLAPHLGYSTGEYLRRTYAAQAEACRAFLTGRPLQVQNPAVLSHARVPQPAAPSRTAS
jgi:phosphoglycerate dehydrogenase-like enzyme